MPKPHVIPLDVRYMGNGNFRLTYDDGVDRVDREQESDDDDDDVKAKTDHLPLITKDFVRGMSHTCRELRNLYHSIYPDRLALSHEKGIIKLNYLSSIIYLGRFEKLVSQPAISHYLFDRISGSISSSNNNNNTSNIKLWHHSYSLEFPKCFNYITHLALPIDCIVEYPELSPHPFTLRSQLNESALFAKMLQPFPNLQYLWAIPDDIYWQLDIQLTLRGFLQPYPGYTNVSVLGCLAERKEQLALWADYRNAMIHRNRSSSSHKLSDGFNIKNYEDSSLLASSLSSSSAATIAALNSSIYTPPALMIWGLEHIDLWDFLYETETQ
ncbi:hypothetical protein OnM2_059025 [Erysiphe neolycopersici]|uniref:Uncharacterized protein n=1 Tax=Erysiphe neolycopersici TaxID=212602 RepID=A0A420HQ09_9PEZI|nr:hypothetical protein OnM2_059025 [Erysiphe neolycopersici]